MELQIVKVENSEHAPFIASLATSYPDFEDEPNAALARYKREIDERKNRAIYLLQDRDGRTVGCVQLILVNADDDPELANASDIAHVHDLRIKSDVQGKGFGKMLMKFIERTAAQSGIRTLTLGVDNWNERAIGMYTKLGYTTFKQAEGRFVGEKVCYMSKNILE